jgi:dihydropteroate synthase
MTNPVDEVVEGLTAAVEQARVAGIARNAIAIDPGIGFGKAADESLAVLKRIGVFSRLDLPILVGTSRKSFIRLLTTDAPETRTWGTAATVVASIMNGAHVVRVHDVRQARVLADVTDRMIS